jgi:CheY-like chemotaxis protein
MGAPVAPSPSGTERDSAPSRSYRVLVVDDDPVVVRSFQRALRQHEVTTAKNGREALEILSGNPAFDVILCDLMMPELTGMDVYERLRETGGGLERKIVFLSGALYSEAVRAFLGTVPNLRFEKPIDSQLLRAVLAAGAEADVA